MDEWAKPTTLAILLNYTLFCFKIQERKYIDKINN